MLDLPCCAGVELAYEIKHTIKGLLENICFIGELALVIYPCNLIKFPHLELFASWLVAGLWCWDVLTRSATLYN